MNSDDITSQNENQISKINNEGPVLEEEKTQHQEQEIDNNFKSNQIEDATEPQEPADKPDLTRDQNLEIQNQVHEPPQNDSQNEQNEEDVNAHEAENEPLTENTISSLISSVSNSHLMSEDNIEAIREVLCKKDNVFYKLSSRDENLQEELLAIIKWKAQIAENTIGQALNYYHQKLLDSELNHLDKLMKILKSNKREMYLRRLSTESHEHNFSNGESESQIPSSDHNEHNFTQNQPKEELPKRAPLANGISLRDLLPEYDSQKRYIRFQLNEKYEVYLKAFEEKSKKKYSIIDKIPQDVLQNHIFIYFNSFDLFKLRAVCSEWRELIRGMWHLIFRREMMEQVIATDLCNDIEMNFKLMSVKSPFYQKFGIFMKAITEIIDWNLFLPSLLSDTVDIKIKMLVVTFFRMIGMYVGFEKLSDYQDAYWNHFKDIASNHLKTFIDSLFHQEFHFKSNYELDIVKEDFLDCPDISSFSIRQLGDKNAIMFQLFLRQLLVFAQLKNYISLAQSYIILAKDKLKEVSKEWPHKKDFLEGAYKILLFKFIEIKNGEVTIVKEDNDRRSGLLRNIQDELDECIHITSSIQNGTSDQDQGGKLEFNSENHKDFESKKEVNVEAVFEERKESDINTNDSQMKKQEIPSNEQAEETLGSLITNEFSAVLNNEVIKPQENFGQEELIPESKEHLEAKTNQSSNLSEDVEQLQKPSRKCDLEEQLSRIIAMKTNSSEAAFDKFVRSKDPDYVISRNGSETRLYLDDMIKIEFLIQKVLKQHILQQDHDCDCPLHIISKGTDANLESVSNHSNEEDLEKKDNAEQETQTEETNNQ